MENTSGKKRFNLKQSVKNLFVEIKTHWKTPPEGRYVPYKEYIDVFIAVGGNYAGSKTLEYISFWSGCYLMMYWYKLPYLTYSIIGLINMPLGYIWALIWWVVCDNLGFLPRKTERRLYILYCSLIAIGLSMILAPYYKLFNPASKFARTMNGLEGVNLDSAFKILGTHILYNGWVGARNIFYRKKLLPKFGRYKYGLYSDYIQKCIMVVLIGWLPIYNNPNMVERVWKANLLFACYNVFGFANNLETCTYNISPNLQDRILVRTYPLKLSHLFNSLLNFILPAVIGALRHSWEDINVFRYVIPITFITFATATMITAGRIKERIPQPPLEEKVQIKFWDGIFGVMHNKYRWINTVVALIDALGNGMLALGTILYLYTFRLSGLAYGLIVGLISFAGTPPDLFTPYFLKKFSYRQIMIFYQVTRAVGYGAVALVIWLCADKLVLAGTLCCVVLFLMEMTKTVPTSAGHDMDIRICDYQMYISGERLESFAGIFGWFTGPITTFVSLIVPLLLLRYGFNTNYDVLFIDESRAKIIAIPMIFDVAGFLLMTIPYFFWDYNNEKQNEVMEVLKRRAYVTEKLAEKKGENTEGAFLG